MSVGLIVALIVAIAVVLSLAVDNDDNRTDQTTAPRAPLSYINEGAGEGLLSGESQAVVPALRSYTSELQGEGHLNTLDDLSVTRPTDRPATGYHPYTEEVGLTEGDVTLTYEEQARLAHDEMLFEEWNDPLGWQATSEPKTEPGAVLSYADILFLEQNGVYDIDRHLAAAPTRPTVDLYARMKFIEMNTNLPGWTDDTSHVSDRQRFTEN